MRYDRQWKIQDWGWKWQIFLKIWHAFVFDCKTVRLYTFRMELTVTKLRCLVWVGYFAIRGWSDSGFFWVFMCCMYGPYGRSWIEPGQLSSCDYSNSHGIILGLCRRKIMKNRCTWIRDLWRWDSEPSKQPAQRLLESKMVAKRAMLSRSRNHSWRCWSSNSSTGWVRTCWNHIFFGAYDLYKYVYDETW